jgi:large subunit ribosomal protein L17
VTTTLYRAKELRPFVERLITIAKCGVATGAENGKALHARRLVMHDLQDREVVSELFDTLAPRFAERPGGYTRLLRLGFRKGDAAEVAQVELVGSEFNPRARTEAEGKKAGRRAQEGQGRRRRTPEGGGRSAPRQERPARGWRREGAEAHGSERGLAQGDDAAQGGRQ